MTVGEHEAARATGHAAEPQAPGNCAPGRRATVSLRVREEDTAAALGSGDVPVLGTPRVLAIAEQAALRALSGSLAADLTTVGAWAEIEHVAPSWVGDDVEATAVLLGVHGRRLEFTITVTSRGREVARVRHRRLIVERRKFDAAAATPQPNVSR